MSYTFFSTTPNQLGSGVLPSRYNEFVFELSDGNWVNDIILPENPADKNSIVIRSSATWDATLQLSSDSSDLLNIKAGYQYMLEYDVNIQEWNIKIMSIDYLTPDSVGSVIPDNPQPLTYYSIDNCNYVAEVTLPTTAENGAVIIFNSTACADSQISGSNIWCGSAKTIKPGEQLIYRYHARSDGSGWIVDPVSIVSNKISDSTVDRSFIDSIVKVDEVANIEQDNCIEIRSIPKTLSTTPNQLGSAVLPSSYDEIVFELSDGNWAKDIILPLQPSDRSRVVIKSSATFDAYLQLPFTSLKISAGSEYFLEYRSDIQQWHITGTGTNLITPNSVGSVIPDNPDGITFYMMESKNWVPEITLPSTANDGSLIIIRSAAINDSKISHEHLLYGSTTTIKSGDQYVFKYIKKLNRWVIESAPIRSIDVDDFQNEIPFPTAQTTLLAITDNNWLDKVVLPENAGDRDKITIKSSVNTITLIDAANINQPGAMKLYNGEKYDFFYIAEKGEWQLINSPDTLYQAQDITDGIVPELYTPRTIINATNKNYQSGLLLPTAQEPGSRVIINSSAKRDISVSADETNYKISYGETVAFKVDERGFWKRETVTIDLLLLYSDKAAARLGEDEMRDFMMEGFYRTNEALENSGANFRFRAVGLRQVEAKAGWNGLNGPLADLRNDPLVQRWRDALKADGIYYVGTEDGCGLAWVGSHGGSNMVATGSLNCSADVMRHEMGHNMGIKHGGEGEEYNYGYELLATIMAGNDIPYYSTPDRYTADYGIPMGIPGRIDAVRVMNEISAVVAAYR
ncbi:M12 family metallo-peptidase [Yersinia alsatica]|uniref:M12 family metallo-peptidase n=1 Tax=Yersinia alsatica TaxID=2890317 RepID=UPI0032EAED1B